MITLRDYQIRARDAVLAAFQEREICPRTLVHAATGTGKTEIIYACLEEFVKQKLRVLVIAGKVDLLSQTYKRLAPVCLDSGLQMTGYRARSTVQLLVCGIKSLPAPGPEGFGRFGRFDVIVIDEVHNAAAPLYKRMLLGSSAFVVGFTATPIRTDKKKLPFKLIFTYSFAEAISEGWVAKPVGEVIACDSLNLDALISKDGDDFDAKALNQALRSPAVVAEMAREISAKADPQCVVFCCSKQHCVDMAAALNAITPNSAAAIYDGCEDREEIWHRARKGTLQYLCNINILIEGIDIPSINTVVFARLTRSVKTYLQMLGRGVRKVPGRDTFTVLDFAGTSMRNKALTLQDVLDHLSGDLILDIPKKREVKPKGKARKIAQGIQDLSIPARVVDEFRMFGGDDLIAFLSQQGVSREVMARRGAKWCQEVREQIIARDRQGLCTWKQAKTLERFGLDGRDCPRKTAGAIMGYILKLGYKGRWPIPTPQIVGQIKRAWPKYARQ